MAIRIHFHGAARTVTGSKHLLELTRRDGSRTRVLLDCGMFQGEALRNGSGNDRNRTFGFDPRSIDLLVLSHAHIDHSGLLPRLVKEGFKGAIWCTPATRDLCAIMLEDSARIQEYDHAFDTKRAMQRGRPVDTDGPLYTVDDVRPALELFQSLDYDEPRELAEGITLRFTDAGHILGSAAVHLQLDDGEQVARLCFTGDVGRYVGRLLPAPQPPPPADFIICESTYGDRLHAPLAEAQEELLGHVREVCVDQGGRLIIPAFSIGKTQEVLYALNALSNEGRLPHLPVYVDSPLAISATDISRQYAHLLRPEVRAELENDPDLFSFPGTEFVRSADRSKQLNGQKRPCIIIAASGMMEAGRVRHHLLHALPDAANGVLAVGFCAPGTLGAELLDGADSVRILGERIPVRASIRRMGFFSAHGDQQELLRYLGGFDAPSVKRLFLVHGIDHALSAMQDACTKQGFSDVAIPRLGEAFDLV
jgi:metallo-beta-lactamase family protein